MAFYRGLTYCLTSILCACDGQVRLNACILSKSDANDLGYLKHA